MFNTCQTTMLQLQIFLKFKMADRRHRQKMFDTIRGIRYKLQFVLNRRDEII